MNKLPKLTFALIAILWASYALRMPVGFGQSADSQPEVAPKGNPNQPADRPGSGPKRPLSVPVAKPESQEAKAALEQARQRLLSHESIKATVVETVAIPSRRFTVHGSYVQGRGDDLKLRLEFRAKLGDSEGSILEVCDGQVLWTRHQIGEETRIFRRDVRQILQAAADKGLKENLITVELGFGGLPGLLASIQNSMVFDQLKHDSADGRELVVIEGTWRPALLKQWQGNDPNAPLPEQVPSRVRLYFDAESMFPRRILYLRHNSEGTLRPMVSLDFTDVQTDVMVPADVFRFVPPDGVFPDDQTQRYLEQIERRSINARKVGEPK